MSHIDFSPSVLGAPQEVEQSSSDFVVTEPVSSGSFGRGLACGLVLAVSFWTFIAIQIFDR